MTRLIVGCGYLGCRVASLWVRPGERTFATTRSPNRAPALHELGLEPIVCDLLDPESLHQLPAVDTVLHAVGLDRSSGRSMREVYVDGLANLLAALPAPARFIHVSSTSVYGQCDGGMVDEESATEPMEESGQIVLAAERLLRSRRPDAIVLRFAGIYGPGRLLRRPAIEKGEPIVADPERWLNLIHVEDGAAAIQAAAASAPPGVICNVCDDHPIPRREFYELLASLLGAPPPRFVKPDPAVPLPPHEQANRRISNRRLHEQLQLSLRYPHFAEGLRASLTSAPSAGPRPGG